MNVLHEAGPEPAEEEPPAEIRVLGCFEVIREGRRTAVGGPLPQAMLARLLVADGAVGVDQLLEDVWAGDPPLRATASLHAYVSRLRAVLPPGAIERRDSSYLLDRRHLRLDAAQFERDLTASRAATAGRQLDAAVAALETALARWQGMFAFGPQRHLPFLQVDAQRLEELRLVAVEELADGRAVLGSAQVDIPTLLELVAHHPLRESLVLRLMRALTDGGRRSEALAAFESCRRSLDEELGVEPGEQLRAEHARLLVRRRGPTPWRLPSRNRSFTGRGALIRDAEQILEAESESPRLVALHGMPGVGKTDLALEIAHRRRREGSLAWWVPADGSASLTTGLTELAAALQLAHRQRQDELIVALWDELDRRGRWLIVFDNVDDAGLLASVLPPAGHGEIIVTSRNPVWRSLGVPLQVPVFDRDESCTFLARRAAGDDPAVLDALADAVGDLPLALEHACAYLDHTRIGSDDYLRLLRTHARAVLAMPGADDDRPSVAATWAVAFDRVRRRSPGAAELLEILAFLAPDAVPVRLLRGPGGDDLAVNEQVAELLRLSLVDRELDALRIHRLVQAVVREGLTPADRQERLAAAVRSVVAAATDLPKDRWGEVVLQMLTLTDHLIDQLTATGVCHPSTTSLLDCAVPCARWLADRALFPAAVDQLRKTVRLAHAGGDRVREGVAASALGESLDRSGDWHHARHELEGAIALLEAELPPDDHRVAQAYHRLGHALNCAGDSRPAVAAQQTAIGLLEGTGHTHQLAVVLTDLGYTHWGAGHLREARTALEHARSVCAALPDARVALAHALAGLGLVEQDAGDLAQAVAYQREALQIFTLEFGPLHPDVAQSWDKLGYVQRLLGDVDGAVLAHERAVSDLEMIFGVRDSRVAMARSNAGLAYRAAGRYREARQAQQQAYDVFRAANGDQHPATLMAARRLAVAWAEDGAPEEARSLAESVFEAVVASRGRVTAETARAEADLALVLDALGDAVAAVIHRMRALATLSHSLGPDHHEVAALAAACVPAALEPATT